MIKVYGEAKIMKADVASVDGYTAKLINVIVSAEKLQATYANNIIECINESRTPYFIIPSINIDTRDTSLNLPYAITQEIRRKRDAYISGQD